MDIEKRIVVNIFSKDNGRASFKFSYVISRTYWQMKYDIRASNENKSVDLVVYANIYQKTEEDWDNVKLSLSTGTPVNAIREPSLYPWLLNVYRRKGRVYDKIRSKRGLYKKSYRKKKEKADDIIRTKIKEKGTYFDISLPLKQSIISSNKYQKKFIQDFKIKGSGKVNFYYELIPSRVRNSFLKVSTKNSTPLPWLKGEAQIFLENEFMGKVSIPHTPIGKKEDLVLGIESRITAKKELVKKYEDKAGIFGGKRRIKYRYKIKVENQLPRSTEVVVYDALPVSQNKEIEVTIEKLSHKFLKDKEFKKSTRYARGIRKWKLNLESHQKIEITYDIILSFDKKLRIRGIR